MNRLYKFKLVSVTTIVIIGMIIVTLIVAPVTKEEESNIIPNDSSIEIKREIKTLDSIKDEKIRYIEKLDDDSTLLIFQQFTSK
jgi:hypothetical protein